MAMIAGVALIPIVILHIITIPVRFEPSTDLLRSVASPPVQASFQLIYWTLTFFPLLAILAFLGLRQLLRTARPGYSLVSTTFGAISSVMYALSSIIFATTIPALAAAYASVSDLDLQRSIGFQASALEALALGIISVASLLFSVSLILWSRAMDRRFGKLSLLTLLLGIYALATILPFGPGWVLPWLTLLLFEGVWLSLLGMKMVVPQSHRSER